MTTVMEMSSKTSFENLVLSIEAPFTNSGVPRKNKVNLFMDSKFLFETIVDKNVIAANLSNNHIMDYGEEAFSYTKRVLNDRGVPIFGAGKLSDNFHNPAIVDDDVALFGYACRSTNGTFGDEFNNGAAPLSLDRIIDDIGKCKSRFKVVNLHWGVEHYSFPKPTDIAIARSLVDGGAHLIIGNHPHKMQCMEVYKGKHIYYSLGNCMFNDVDVPTYHNGIEFTRRFTWKFKKRSRISAKVCLNTESGVVTDEFLYQVGNRLRPFQSPLTRIRFMYVPGRIGFLFYSSYKKLRYYLSICLKNPRKVVSRLIEKSSSR